MQPTEDAISFRIYLMVMQILFQKFSLILLLQPLPIFSKFYEMLILQPKNINTSHDQIISEAQCMSEQCVKFPIKIK